MTNESKQYVVDEMNKTAIKNFEIIEHVYDYDDDDYAIEFTISDYFKVNITVRYELGSFMLTVTDMEYGDKMINEMLFAYFNCSISEFVNFVLNIIDHANY